MVALLIGAATGQSSEPIQKEVSNPPAQAVASTEEVLASSTSAIAESATVSNETYVRKEVEAYFADVPVMQRIAWCESKFRHRKTDGSVVRGVVKSDVGVMQINEYYHQSTAVRLGLDLSKLKDNMAYARWLYNREGTKPWVSSAHCWDNSNVLAFAK